MRQGGTLRRRLRVGRRDRAGSSPTATWRPSTRRTIPGFGDVAPFLQNAPHYVVDGKHYGIPHGWGGNTLMYRTDSVTPAPTSWNVVFDPTAAAPYAGKITAYDSPIYIADAALYLKAHNPELGITDPYELTQPQFDAAVEPAQAAAPVGRQVLVRLLRRDRQLHQRHDDASGRRGRTSSTRSSRPASPVGQVVPTEGMTGWADTWMLSSKAQHPNCMLKWMAWMLTPEVQTQVAEYFGEAPANPKACKYLDAQLRLVRVQGLLQPVRRQRPERSTTRSRSGRRRSPTAATTAARPASTTRRGPRSGRRSRAEPEPRPRTPGLAARPAAPRAAVA